MKDNNQGALVKKETKKETRQMATIFTVVTALLLAVEIVVTTFISIPMPFLGSLGNINIGDSVIMVASLLLGGIGGGIVGGVGACVADLISGYYMYAPFTLIIKFLEGLIMGLFFKSIKNKFKPLPSRILTFIMGAAIVVVGYFFAEFALQLMIGQAFTPSIIIALGTLATNPIQVTASAVLALIIAPKITTLYDRIP